MKNLLLLLLVFVSNISIAQESFPLPEVYSYEDQGTVLLKDKLTKLTVIDLWATWCKPCIEETPYLEEIKKKYGDKIDVFFISLDQDKEKWNNYVSKKKSSTHSFWVAGDNAIVSHITETIEMGGTKTSTWSIPRFFLIDKDGKKLSRFCPLPSSGNLEHLIKRFIK